MKELAVVLKYNRLEKIILALWGAVVILMMLHGNLLLLLIMVASYPVLQGWMLWRRRDP